MLFVLPPFTFHFFKRFNRSHNNISAISISLNEALPNILSFFIVNETLPDPHICCRFEIAIFVLIFLNMLTMGIEHYNQPHAIFFILEVSNAFFTTVFGLGKLNKRKKLRSALKTLSKKFEYN